MLTIGMTLILELIDSAKSEQYRCRVVDIVDQSIFIDYPVNMNTNKTAFLLNGTSLNASFVATEQNAFMFHSSVVGRTRSKIPMIQLSYPGDDRLIRIQRRQYVRVDSSLDIAIHPITSNMSPFVTVTTDISAGGVAIILPNKMDISFGTILSINLVLPMKKGDISYLTLKGKAVRVIEVNPDQRKLSVEFLDVNDQDQQSLIRYCFEKQLDNRKKAMID